VIDSILLWARTLRGRLVSGLGLLVACAVGSAVVGTAAFRMVTRDYAASQESVTRWGNATTRFQANVLEMIAAGQAYFADERPRTANGTQVIGNPAVTARFHQASDATFSELRQLRSLSDLADDDRILIGRLSDLQAQLEVEYSLAHAYFDLGRANESRIATARTRTTVDAMTAAVRHLTRRQANRSEALAARIAQTVRGRELLLILLVLVSAGGGAGIAWALVRGIEAPLSRLESAADQFGHGDLRPVETGEMFPEFEALAAAFNAMGERLRSIVGDVIQESDRISTSAGDLSAVSEQLAASSSEITSSMLQVSSNAESQVARLAEVSAGLSELGESAAAAETSAVSVASLGEKIRGTAGRHQRDVSETVVALLAVQDIVKTSASEVAELAESSAAIDEFVRLVKRIASQTNLLALNATIEAARAGEHGRGFAVVAEEVRKLADESAAGAERVAQTLQFIRDQVGRVTNIMQGGLEKVRGVESVSSAAAAGLAEILASVSGIEEAARSVATTAARNRTFAEGVGAGVGEAAGQAGKHAAAAESVTAAAEQQGASTEEMASAAGELLHAAERLRGVVSGFKL